MPGTHQKKQTMPPQEQPKPGLESQMRPRPRYMAANYKGADKLLGKVALITGGDSGIGRAVAVLFAREGADVAIVYLPVEQSDAEQTQVAVQAEGRKCLLLPGDLTDSTFCRQAVEQTVQEFGKLDILVNNAAYQAEQKTLEAISQEQLEHTFRTNIFAFFHLTQAALTHLPEGGCIINTGSITGSRGSAHLVDYSATKGAIQALTYSLAQQLIEKGIRVNGVAPGPVWTPLIPATFSKEEVEKFGTNTPMKRPAQPSEIAPAYVFLASDDASYINGQFIHINGGSLMH